jgi:hypothetical protein
VLRAPGLPEPTQQQVDEAIQVHKARGAPHWRHVTSLSPFHRWLAELHDPFADVYLQWVPNLSTTEATKIVPADMACSARLRDLAPEAVSRYQTAQRQAMDALVEAVSNVDPAPLLAGMILMTQAEPWGTYFEPTSRPNSLDLELVAGIVASSPCDDYQPATADAVMLVALSAQNLRWWAHAVGLAHSFAQESDIATRVREDLLLRWLSWRGGAYPTHAMSAAEALASDQEDNLTTRLGFGFNDLADFALALRRKHELSITPALDGAWEHAISVTNERPDNLGAGSPRFQSEWFTTALNLLPDAFGIPLDDGPHLLGAGRDQIEVAIVQALALSPGSSKPVTSVLVDPPHRVKPFVLLPNQHNATDGEMKPKLALPVNLRAFTTDFHLTVEALLAQTFPKWPAMRARAVDSCAVTLIQRALPGSRAVTNVFLDGPGGREEVDGILVYDDAVIVIEGKGAMLKVAALRGSVEKFVSQLQELVTKGSRQLDRDRSYVLCGGSARFYDAAGSCVLDITSTSVRRCYQMLPCLDGLSDIGTTLPRLTALGVLDDTAKPWIVGITDLNAVVDILNKPAELIGYLEFRERWIREPGLVITDEFELLALYLYQVDLSAKLAMLPEGGQAIAAPSQALFDAWYDGLSGYGPVVDKPRIKTTPRLRRFVDEVQRTKPDGWLATTTAALQVPLTVATALDQAEATLARRARTQGMSVTGDPEYRIVVVAQNQEYPDSLDGLASERHDREPVCLFLRQHGGRLRLEDVRLAPTVN